MRAATITAALLLVAGLAPTTGAHDPGDLHDGDISDIDDPSDLYQNDGGSGEDASDDCRESDLDLRPRQPLEERQGNLVLGDDMADTWRLTDVDGSTFVSLFAGQLLELPTGTNSQATARVELQVFEFPEDKRPEGLSLLACQEPDYADATHSGGEAFVQFDVDPGMDYLVRAEITGIDGVELPQPGATPVNGHCRPTCFQSVQLAV